MIEEPLPPVLLRVQEQTIAPDFLNRSSGDQTQILRLDEIILLDELSAHPHL